MSMSNLTTFLKSENEYRKLFGLSALVLPRDKSKVIEILECKLSPENLSCDGERDPWQVRSMGKQLAGALEIARRA